MTNTAKEFKDFINKGNVVALAVGIIMGAEFNKIVSSLVDDVIMPLVGKVLGNTNFSNMYLDLSGNVPAGTALADAKKLGAVFAYGNFVTAIVNFLIIALAVFWIVKMVNKVMPPAVEAPKA